MVRRKLVNEHTVPSPETDKDKDRMKAETVLFDGPWSTMVLRSSAVYGTGPGCALVDTAGDVSTGSGRESGG